MAFNDEYKVQVAIIKWLRETMPKALIQHSKNEHQKRGKAGMLAAVRDRSAGVMKGFPDLIVMPENGRAFMLEVKSPKGRVGDAQAVVHSMLRNNGYPVAVVRSIDDVRAFLQAESIDFTEVVY